MMLVKKIRWHGTAVWLAAFVMFGCLPEGQAVGRKTMPNQAEAEYIVWHDVFEMDMSTMPEVRWIEGAALNCPWNQGLSFQYQDTCAWGAAYAEDGFVALAHPDGGEPYWRSTLPHELCHFRSYLLTGDADGGHVGPCFRGLDLSTKAQVALMSAGLQD